MDRIIPNKRTSTITIPKEQYSKLDSYMYKKLWNFYIYKKSVNGDKIVLEVKSNVVNSFCGMLNFWEIDWRFERFHRLYN